MVPKAIVFDVLGTILDASKIVDRLNGLVPDPAATARLWRQKQVEYGILASAAHHDTNFHRITLEALEYALGKAKTTLGDEQKEQLVHAWSDLPPYPDAEAALAKLSERAPLLALTNGSEKGTLEALTKAGLDVYFKWVRSADEARRQKPSPEVYEIALHALHTSKPEELVYVSGNPWDVAGAGLFGFVTCRVQRTDEPDERFGVAPEIVVRSLGELEGRLTKKLAA